jgi:hypothetical protein
VSISVILVNAIIFIVIGILRDDPLPTGTLGVFFEEKDIMCVLFNQLPLTGLVLWPYIYGYFLRSIFYGGVSPSKIGLIAPY